MSFADRYQEEIAALFAEAAAETATFPAPLNEIGAALLTKLNPIAGGAGTNFITFLLPYWLREQTGHSEEFCRDLAAGNALAMVHFFLLDDAMDSDSIGGRLKAREALALGQLFQASFQRKYGLHFPSDSPLWSYYRSYLGQWAAAVSQEGKRQADPSDPARLAAKSAPVKLCAAGMLLLSGQSRRIPKMETAIDFVLASLQLSDDWADWEEDLKDEGGGSANAFLTLVRERIGLPAGEPLDEPSVKRAVFGKNALSELADLVRSHGERMRGLGEFTIPLPLIEMQETILSGLDKDAAEVMRMADQLASEGGLSYFLSKYAIK